MPTAPLPAHETARLTTLGRCMLLDTPAEAVFDRLTALTAHLFHAPIAYIGLRDKKRQWLKSRVGLSAQESERAQAFCAHALLSTEPLVVGDAAADPRFADHPL